MYTSTPPHRGGNDTERPHAVQTDVYGSRFTGSPILPFETHWNTSPSFQLRYVPIERNEREAMKIGLDLDMFHGRVQTVAKYKVDDIRFGVRGNPAPDEIFGSVGVLGTSSNRLIMTYDHFPNPRRRSLLSFLITYLACLSLLLGRWDVFLEKNPSFAFLLCLGKNRVAYSIQRSEPLVTFKVKSKDLLRARVGGRSGAVNDSPAGLDYKLKLNLSPTSKIKVCLAV